MLQKIEVSSKVLILINAITIILAIFLNYDLAMIVWIYYLESAIIGFFSFLTLLLEGFRSNKTLGVLSVLFFAFFFLFHYGGFHLVYLIFLFSLDIFTINPSNYFYVVLGAGLLFLSHSFSFFQNIIRRKESTSFDISSQFVSPYSRIIPIHLTIIMSGFAIALGQPFAKTLVLVFFMGLKTVIDYSAHVKKHKF